MKYRVIKLTDDKWYAQTFAPCLGNPPAWVFLGAIGIPDICKWSYRHDEFACDSQHDAERLIDEFIRQSRLSIGAEIKEEHKYTPQR